eukprot:TRINITY_DN2383_c0_g1_i1.p1 TRINITY_DN2383_c0_g1~~TRINITY_DN2383_c0_g1_i1.p1  ORF type:complete len:202 (+),score=27.75 TRINITY_DN2383_c0_g1_i1:205-810(+)
MFSNQRPDEENPQPFVETNETISDTFRPSEKLNFENGWYRVYSLKFPWPSMALGLIFAGFFTGIGLYKLYHWGERSILGVIFYGSILLISIRALRVLFLQSQKIVQELALKDDGRTIRVQHFGRSFTSVNTEFQIKNIVRPKKEHVEAMTKMPFYPLIFIGKQFFLFPNGTVYHNEALKAIKLGQEFDLSEEKPPEEIIIQ